MKANWKNRLLALLLAVCTVFGLCVPAQAASIGDGSKTCTVALGDRSNILETTAGTILRAGGYTYTTNDGLSGPAYCIDHGLDYTDKVLPITGKYTASPATAGAFANGYPQHSLATFLGLYLENNDVLSGLTEAEYAYATQVAVWATLGQLGVDGTPYTAGREYLNPPTGDIQQTRVFRAAQLILDMASTWDRVYQTGMYIRLDENKLDGNLTIPGNMTLEFAADRNEYGIKCEVINGVSYYTREYIFASATSTYYSDYSIELWADNAPAGTIFTDLNNVELARSNFRETATWRLPTEAHYGAGSQINNNGYEYWGKAKLCIPVDTAPNSGKITINCGAYVMQYEIYLANNEDYSEQSYIIADPSKGTQTANALLSWGSDITEVGHLQVTKVGGGGDPLPGAEFTLTGTDGTSKTATTNENGIILWTNLDPHALYTLTETKAPAGYAVTEARNVTITAAHTTYETVKDNTLQTLTVKKIDKQSGYSLRGAVYSFEQIDGDYKTTATTDHAGLIQFDADQLPIGSYKVYEVAAPEGYELDSTAQTVHWDGKRDVTLTFSDVRKTTLILSKKDSRTGYNLPEASFAVYRDGQLVTTVTTNDNGLAYVADVKEGYYEVKEVSAPAGYLLNTNTYGINIDPYDPATTDDPRLVIEDDPMPSLRIVKYDRDSGKPLDGVTFKVYRNATLYGTYTTDKAGEIILTGLEPGTYAVEEVNAGAYVADAAPQQIEVEAGRTEQATLFFFNSPKPGIHVRKVDADTLKPLAGGTFLISQVDGGYRKELPTDENGEIDLTGLEPGTYTVQETVAPAGYLLDNAVRIFEIEAGQDAEFVFTDSKKPGLTLTKRDTSGSPMAGVAFSLTPMGDGTHSDERTTNVQGVITWEGLEPGLYSLVEIATKDGYVLDSTEHHVRLYAGRDGSVMLTNLEKPSLRLVKYDRTSHSPMSGVTFEIFRDTTSLGKFQTDENGAILLDHIDPGTYKAVEVDVGNDTHILVTTPQEVELHAGDGVRELVFINDLLPGVHLVKVDSADLSTPIANAKFRFESVAGDYGPVEYTTGADGTIDLSKLPVGAYVVTELACPGYVVDDAQRIIHLDGNETAQFVFTNTSKPDLKIIKTDSVSGKPVQGVTFTIKLADGRTITTLASDASGEVLLEDMDPGVVEIWEQDVPYTYLLNDEHQLVTLTPGQLTTVHFENDPKLSLRIVKYDQQTDAPLPNTTFQVYRDTVLLGEYTTDATGEILLTGLMPGTYLVQEIKAPDTHTVNSIPQQIELKEGTGEIASLVFFDVLKPGIHLVKVDSDTMASLSGATFRINKVGGSFEQEYVTDADGEIDLSKLEPGAYQIQEVKAPDGYLVDSGIRTVEVKAGENALFVFTDTRKPTLTVLKYDPAQNKYLPNATIRIAKVEDGSDYMDRVTDDQGRIIIDDLEPGVYSVQEAAAPEGYVLNNTEYHVELFPGKTSEVVVINEEKPSLKITKYDRQSHAPLSGVTFEVFRDTISIGKFQTDESGAILLDHVDPGTYKAVEVDVGNDTHILVTTPQEVELHAGDGVRELAFINDLLPGVHLVKVDSADLSTPIANAKFRFESVAGDYGPVEYSTGADGTIDLSKLPTGAYVVTELECAGYVVDDAQRIIQLDGNENAQFVFTNSKLPSLTLTKTSADGSPLAGVTFRLTRIADGSRYLDRATSTDGTITWEGLEPGVYSLQETATVPTHILDEKEYHVELFPGKDSTIVLSNDRRPNLTIHKTDADTGEVVPDTVFFVKAVDGSTINEVKTGADGTAKLDNMLPGVYEVTEKSVPTPYLLDAPAQTITLYPNRDTDVHFKNHKAPTVQIVKEDSITHDPIPNVRFQVWYASNATSTGEYNDLGVYTTDAQGRIDLSRPTTGLRDGWFRVKELAPASGYAIKDSDTQEAFVQSGKSHIFRFENTPLSAIVVWKYDSVTGVAVEGATFQIKYLSGTSGTGGTVIGTYKTSANGSFTVTGLETGTYIVEELASDSGHVIDTAPQTVYISGEDQDVAQIYFGNSPKGALLVKKMDASDNSPLSDVEFMVTDSTGAVMGDANGKFVTDSAGTFLVENITPGTTLVVKETRAKSGYLLDDTPQTAQIKAGQTVTLEFRNQPKGNLIIRKLDSVSREPLEGVEFKITYADGKVVDNGKLSSNGIYYTDKNGQIVLSGITGTVIVTETKTISGYTIDPNTQSQTVVVNPDDTQTLTFYNNPIGGVEIIKVNAEDKTERIPGVTFEVRRMDGALVDTVTTDKRGRAYLTLEDGSYYAVEVEAAEGYKLDATPHYFTIKDGKRTTLTVTNQPYSGIVIHKTDSTTGAGIYGVSFLVYNNQMTPIGQVTTNQDGYAYVEDLDAEGWYYLRELENEGYLPDTQLKQVYVKAGESTVVEWQNAPVTGQIQLTKTSADYNSTNGWAAGTPIPGCEFEIYDKAGNLVDTIRTDKNGVAASKVLPLGQYKVVESKAADYYALDATPYYVELQYAGQIVRIAATNKSIKTGVSISKTGYKEVMPGQTERFTFADIGNASTVSLQNFYWRDTIPTDALRLNKVVTGSWNVESSYKIVYLTNKSGGEYRTLADNLSTRKVYTIDASPMALGLARDEYVTEVMAVFGVVPAGFHQVEAPTLDFTVVSGLQNGYQFANNADAGGIYNGAWVQAVTRWVTTVYAPTKPLPRTGY